MQSDGVFDANGGHLMHVTRYSCNLVASRVPLLYSTAQLLSTVVPLQHLARSSCDTQSTQPFHRHYKIIVTHAAINQCRTAC